VKVYIPKGMATASSRNNALRSAFLFMKDEVSHLQM
jgi:hypothetical protein